MKLYCRLELAYGLLAGHLSLVVFALRFIYDKSFFALDLLWELNL